MTRATKLPCGCTHDGQRWLSECSKHKAENDALHERALIEHRGTTRGTWRSGSPPIGLPDNLPRASIPDASWLDIPDSN